MNQDSWEIRSKDNELRFVVEKVEYNDEWMQQRYVTVSIESPVPIGFQIGDYLIYRDERFEINYDPGKIKSAEPYDEGDAFRYENVKFNSLADELTRCGFLDVVLNDNQLHFTGLPKFSFYGGVRQLADRIQANLNRAYGKDTWSVVIDPEFKSDTELNVSVDKIKVSGALEILVNQFKTYYTIKGRTLTIGAAGVPADHLFKYGPGQGLYEIEENAEADQQIVTRLRAYGSTRNLPHRYYNSLTDADGIKLIPDNMAVQCLMLPEFPYTTQDPYIDSKNIDALGVREDSIFFDGSDPDLPETYPSIEGMTADQLKAAGLPCNADGELDVLVSAEQMTDNGVGKIEGDAFEGNATTTAEPETFKITIKDVGFDINDHIIEGNSEKPTVSFKSGKLGGRDFEIVKCTPLKSSGNTTGYELELNRVYDDDIKLWFPYKDYNAEAGDKFVLLNIKMPEVYTKAASQLLKDRAQAWLDKNDYSRSVYAPKIDENFMARQHDAAMASGGTIKSLHDTLCAGMQLLFEDEDLGIDAAIFIDRLTIIEGDGSIPTYEVVLKEEKTVGRLDKMQNQIDSLASGQGQGSGGYNASQIRAIMETYGGARFLAKTKADRTPYALAVGEKLTAEGGLQIGKSFIPGIAGGKGAFISEDGDGELQSLILREWLEVPELRYNRVSIKVGVDWNAPGGGIIESAGVPSMELPENPEVPLPIQPYALTPEINPGIGAEQSLLYAKLKLEDGEIATVEPGDLCMGIWHFTGDKESLNATENIDNNGQFSFRGFCTIYFEVTSVSADGKGFYYKLRNGYTVHPQPGMSFVAYGNNRDESRRKSRYSTRSYVRFLDGVDDWNWTEENIAAQFGDLSNLTIDGLEMSGYSLYANNVYFKGILDKINEKVDEKISETVAIKRGPDEWRSGTTYYDGKDGENGIRFMDWVFTTDANGNKSVWACIKSHKASQYNKPKTGSEYWSAVSNVGNLYASTFFAPDAKIDFLTGQEIVLVEEVDELQQGVIGPIDPSIPADPFIPATLSETDTEQSTDVTAGDISEGFKDLTASESIFVKRRKVYGRIGSGEHPIFLGGENADEAIFTIGKKGKTRYGKTGGKHIEIDPDSKKIGVFDDNGSMALEVSGDRKDYTDIFAGKESLTGTFGSQYQLSTVHLGGGEGYKEISHEYTSSLLNIKAGGRLKVTLDYSWAVTGYGTSSSGDPDLMDPLEASVDIIATIQKQNGSSWDEIAYKSIGHSAQLEYTSGDGSFDFDVNILEGGNYRLRIEYTLGRNAIIEGDDLKHCDAFATTSDSSYVVTYSNSVSALLANGYFIGSSADNHFSAWLDKTTGALNAIIANENYGLKIDSTGIFTRKGMGTWGRMHQTLFKAGVWQDSGVWKLTPQGSVDGQNPTVQSVANGVYKLKFPTSWKSLFNEWEWQYTDYWHFCVYSIGSTPIMWSVKTWNETYIEISVKDNTGANYAGALTVMVEYTGS